MRQYVPFDVQDGLDYWQSEKSVEVPEINIVQWAFEGTSEYDRSKPLFVDARDPASHVTANEAEDTIFRLAAGLRQHGLQKGDCVCIHTCNNIFYPLVWLGTIAAGGIVSGSNPASTSQELIHHFRNTNTKYVITHVDCLATGVVQEAITQSGILTSNVFVLSDHASSVKSDYCSWLDLLDHYTGHHKASNHVFEETSHNTVHAATSGTTGLPKAAVLTNRSMVAQAVLLEDLFEHRSKVETIKQLHCLPVFHSFASQLAMILPLRLGITTYFLPRFDTADPDKYIKAVDDYDITDVAVVPPIITRLLCLPEKDRPRLRSLRYVICAGAPMNAAIQESFNHILHPDATVAQCWGTTELGWVTVFPPLERDTSGSVGRLLPNTSLKIVGEDGNAITEDGILGEACIRSPGMFSGYRGNDDLNCGTHDAHGFYNTGDRVYMKDGKLYIVGRIKDIMKVNGWQVSPEELQIVIMQLKSRGVQDCAVVGKNEVNNQGLQVTLPKAFVVKDSSSSLTVEEIKKHVADNLIGYKRLTGGVEFVEKIPRSATGKILRRLL